MNNNDFKLSDQSKLIGIKNKEDCMKISRLMYFTAFTLLMTLVLTSSVYATPSTTFWSPCTIDIQPGGVLHIGEDNYFTVFRKFRRTPYTSNGAGMFATDTGLTMGVLPFDKVRMEVGVDLLEPSNFSLYFNGKIGLTDGAMFPYSPTIAAGVFNVGTHRKNTADKTNMELSNRNDYNIGYVLIGKDIPYVGRVAGAYYYGNPLALLSSNEHWPVGWPGTDPILRTYSYLAAKQRKANQGFMVAYDHGFWPVKDSSGDEYNRIVLAADYVSGKNYIGGFGGGLYYYFNKDISLLVGPVWFYDKTMNGQWKITVQLDINFDIAGKIKSWSESKSESKAKS
jgi:hypothetical protein